MQNNLNFSELIENAIKSAKLKKAAVTAELGLHQTSFARSLKGQVSKSNAILFIRAVNKLAKRQIINETEGLKIAGYESEPDSIEFLELGPGVTVTIQKGMYSPAQCANLKENLALTLEVTLLKFRREKDDHYPDVLMG
jgi:hypothetical protein